MNFTALKIRGLADIIRVKTEENNTVIRKKYSFNGQID